MKMQWIKCSDHLPDVDQNVLIWDGDCIYGGFKTEFLGQERWAINSKCHYYTYRLKEFTHWMEMPEGPKDD